MLYTPHSYVANGQTPFPPFPTLQTIGSPAPDPSDGAAILLLLFLSPGLLERLFRASSLAQESNSS